MQNIACPNLPFFKSTLTPPPPTKKKEPQTKKKCGRFGGDDQFLHLNFPLRKKQRRNDMFTVTIETTWANTASSFTYPMIQCESKVKCNMSENDFSLYILWNTKTLAQRMEQYQTY